MSSNGLPPGSGVSFPSLVPSPPTFSSTIPSTTPTPIPVPGTLPTSIPTSTSTPPTPTDFTVVLPFPPPSSTTLTSLITIQATSITTIITTTIPTNIISTTTETSTTLSISIIPFANPAATSAIAGQTSLLRSNASLSKTNITVSLVLGGLSLLLLAVLLTIFLCYVRRRRRKDASERESEDDAESSPFTSLAPRPAMGFREGTFGSASGGLGLGLGFGGTSALPVGVRINRSSARDWERPLVGEMLETSLSRGPRGVTVEDEERAVAGGLGGDGVGALGGGGAAGGGPSVSTPPRVFIRSSSAPVEAPTPPPRIPPFKGLNMSSMGLFGNSPRATPTPTPNSKRKQTEPELRNKLSMTFSVGSGIGGGLHSAPLEPRPPMEIMKLVRQSSMPLYHEALRDQADMERETSGRVQAEGLGLPIIALQRTSSRSEDGMDREESLVSELFGSEDAVGKSGERGEVEEEESDSSGERDRERERKAGLGLRVGMSGNGGDNERVAVLHSTRASSGVFPEGEREVQRDVQERSEKDVYS